MLFSVNIRNTPGNLIYRYRYSSSRSKCTATFFSLNSLVTG